MLSPNECTVQSPKKKPAEVKFTNPSANTVLLQWKQPDKANVINPSEGEEK